LRINAGASGDRVQGHLQPRPYGGGAGVAALPSSGGGVGGAGEVLQVVTFGVVELQGPGDRVEDRVGDAGQVAPFEPGVILDADPSQHRDLSATQPGHPPVAAGWQLDLLGADLRAAGGEEVTDFLVVRHGHAIHDRSVTMILRFPVRFTVSTPFGSDSHGRAGDGLMGVCRPLTEEP
jgi:hypothetical protein